MALPFKTVWNVELEDWVSIPPVTHGSAIVCRVGERLRAIDARNGDELWNVVVDPGLGSGHLLHQFEDLTLTDRRPDPKHLTEIVAVKGGKIAWKLDLGCVVESGASVVGAGMLYVVGNAPGGMKLRGFDLATRKKVVDAPLDLGADAIAQVEDRFLILNRMGTPGMYWVKPDGTDAGALEPRQAQEMRLSGKRVIAALSDEEWPKRTIQARDLATGKALWTAPAHGPAIGLDEMDVGHYEAGGPEGTPVVRDAATGKVRWRGQPIASDASRVTFAGAHVFFGHLTGMTAYRRLDGTLVGEIESGRTARFLGERLYLGGFEFLACVDEG